MEQLQITRVGLQYTGVEPPTLVLPLVYDVNTNLTQLAEKRDPGPASAISAASMQLKRFLECNPMHNECSLFPAVRDLLANLVLSSEPPQVVSSPGVMVGPGSGQMQSPSMMHSPMGVGVVGQPGPQYPVPMPPMGQHPMMGPQ